MGRGLRGRHCVVNGKGIKGKNIQTINSNALALDLTLIDHDSEISIFFTYL